MFPLHHSFSSLGVSSTRANAQLTVIKFIYLHCVHKFLPTLTTSATCDSSCRLLSRQAAIDFSTLIVCEGVLSLDNGAMYVTVHALHSLEVLTSGYLQHLCIGLRPSLQTVIYKHCITSLFIPHTSLSLYTNKIQKHQNCKVTFQLLEEGKIIQ